MHDLRFALRQLLRNPGFTAVAVLTLALGIGANTAIFGFINAVLLQPLPYPDADRLVRIASVNPNLGVSDSRSSDLNVLDWQARSTVFEELAAFQEWEGVLTIAGQSESVRVNWTTPNLLPMLGVQPMSGRSLTDSDAGSGMMLPYGIWERFGRDATIIGKTVKLDGETGTIVGILPPKAAAPTQGVRSFDQVFIASDLRRTGWPRSLLLRNVVGRLKSGVTVGQAQTDLSRVAAVMEREFPDTNRGWGVKVTHLKTWETHFVRGQLLAVYGATAIVMLIACLNVSNLLLIRGEARRKEMAIREALGSTRWRLVRQLLSESFLLSLAGVAAGLFMAVWGQRALLALAPGSLGLRSSGLDLSVLGSALIVTIMAALLSGLFPALRLRCGNLRHAVAEMDRSSSPGRHRHRVLNGLVVGQIAVSMALLFAAGLMFVSFQKLMHVDPGFALRNAICFRVGTFSKSVTVEHLIQKLSHLPGVRSVGAANIDLMNDVFSNGIRITADNTAAPGGSISGTVDVWHATTNYFSAAGIPLRAGRVFEAKDRYDVVIVNEALARQFFPNQDALGRVIRVPWTNSPGSPKRIVGIVASVKQHGLQVPEVPIYYMHYQEEYMGSLTVTVSSTQNTTALLPAIRDAIRKMDPELVMSHVSRTDEIVARSLSSHRFATVLMLGFAGLAILLAVVGLYGVMSYTVSRRTREIGVRLALGAQRGHVFQLIIGRGMRLVGLGIGAGLVGALITARGIRYLLFEVSPADPMTFAAMAVLLGAVTFLACYVPARRAAKVHPMEALRHE